MSTLLVLVATAAVCFAVTEVMSRAALVIGLVDSPNGRKHHTGEVPLVGGIAIFLTLLAVVWVFPDDVWLPDELVLISGLLVFMGLADDAWDLGASLRLVLQIAVSACVVYFLDLRVETIGSITGESPLQLGWVTSLIFTTLCFVGVINAINMIDGLDGLAGSILLASFAALTYLAYMSGSSHISALACICVCLLVFLWYNSRLVRNQARIFLGDSGSMFLGLLLACYFVKLSQGDEPAMTAVSAGWIFGLPLLETVAIMVTRMIGGKSPFASGRDHLHHRLLNAGFRTNGVVLCMLFVHIVMVAVGVVFAADNGSEMPLFWLFVVLTALHFLNYRYVLTECRKTVVE